jgi:2C-methyl-D-erythritol 2,4-cyclodiphosphate synthase
MAKFWKKFNLSITGRINVSKSLLLSQLTYAGSIIMPTAEQMSTIENVIIDFIASDLRISKKQVTVSVKKGGMGMLIA